MFLEIFTTQVSSVYKRFLLHIGSSALQCTTYYNLFRKSHSRHGPILYSCNTQQHSLLPLMQIWLFIVPEAMTMASRLCRETQTSLCIKNPANITAIRKQQQQQYQYIPGSSLYERDYFIFSCYNTGYLGDQSKESS